MYAKMENDNTSEGEPAYQTKKPSKKKKKGPVEPTLYMSPVLANAYKNRAWVIEIVFGSVMGLCGAIMLLVSYLQEGKDYDPTLRGISYSFCGLGGLFILLGFCWYTNLQKLEENRQNEMDPLRASESMTTQQTMVSGKWAASSPQGLWKVFPSSCVNIAFKEWILSLSVKDYFKD